MPYVGNQIRQFSDRVVLDSLTASATADYTLQLNSVNFVPSSAESLTVSLNGIIQAPISSYTVSGSTLSFDSALTASDTIDFVIAERGITLQTPSAGSVNTTQLATDAVSTAKIADNAVSLAKMFSTFKNGITMAQQWSLSADTNSGSDADITSNWEESDYANYGGIGTGLTESSGIFTFPQTGIYLITGSFLLLAVSGDTFAGVNVRTTTDGTNYNTAAQGSAGNGGSSNTFNTATFQFIFDVENITTHKIKFITNSFSTGTYIYGGTDLSRSGFTVTRLGDT